MKPRGSLALALLAAGCASSREKAPDAPEVVQSVAAIADELVERAELRTDVRALRVSVLALREAVPVEGAPASRSAAAVAGELAHELSIALADRINLLEFAWLPRPEAGGPLDADLREHARSLGATHVLLGDFVRRGPSIDLSVRLVDASNLLIVAAARGAVPVEALSEAARAEPQPGPATLALAPLRVPPPSPAAPADVAPRDLVQHMPPRETPQPFAASQPLGAQRAAAADAGAKPSAPDTTGRSNPVPDFQTWYAERKRLRALQERYPAPKEAASPLPEKGPGAARLEALGAQQHP